MVDIQTFTAIHTNIYNLHTPFHCSFTSFFSLLLHFYCNSHIRCVIIIFPNQLNGKVGKIFKKKSNKIPCVHFVVHIHIHVVSNHSSTHSYQTYCILYIYIDDINTEKGKKNPMLTLQAIEYVILIKEETKWLYALSRQWYLVE